MSVCHEQCYSTFTSSDVARRGTPKVEWKGTLYVASVKTPCDEIFPVAMGIMSKNKNEEGWTWFLTLLLSACEFLVVGHPKASVD